MELRNGAVPGCWARLCEVVIRLAGSRKPEPTAPFLKDGFDLHRGPRPDSLPGAKNR